MTNDIKRLADLLKTMESKPEITCPRIESGESCNGCEFDISTVRCDITARKAAWLIQNGVFVPPINNGDTVYFVWCFIEVREGKVTALYQNSDMSWSFRVSCKSICYEVEAEQIGKTVFLTKEEAEQKIKELKENG